MPDYSYSDDVMSHPTPRSLVEEIELQTGRAVEIEATECLRSFAKCHAQDQSPLFADMPREIREFIWQYATAPFEDIRHPYEENEYYYRPGHTHRMKSDTSLLLTCRRIWLEANALPMLQAEHCFWYYREAPDARSTSWMEHLTSLNRANFGHLHLFAQMFAIEPLTCDTGSLRNFFLQSSPKKDDFQPRMLHVTIRHSDWWGWEIDVPLAFKDSWLHAILNSPDLRSTEVFKLELETLDYRVNQLLNIVDRLERIESQELETHVIDDRAVTTKFVRDPNREVNSWSGPVNIDGQEFSPYKDMSSLKYHIITLTWRLKFPQIPNAHVASMRLAPRISAPLPQETSFIEDEDDDEDHEDHEDPEDAEDYDELDQSLYCELDRDSFDSAASSHGEEELKAGLSPLDSPLVEMLAAERGMRTKSTGQDSAQEWSRRKLFTDRMATIYVDEWTEHWQSEKSLLKFVQ